jgi:autonomous glycyl radical cofactor GrcA
MRMLSVAGMLAALLLLASSGPQAQTYSRGQNASPAFEGWERNADGSFNFVFGYMNRNWDEELNVPIGPDNNIEPGGPDRGQPTRLLPRRNRFVFRVTVPADWGQEKELIWTLTTKGNTERAYASLRQDYFMDDVVIASETGALGAGTSSPEVRANTPPKIRVDGDKHRRVAVGEPLMLAAWVTDDGVPKPRAAASAAATARALASLANASPNAPRNPAYNPPSRLTVNKRTGLHMMWFVYRGPGQARFEPMQIKPWEDTRTGANSPWAPLWTPPPVPADGKYTATVTFDTPGTYVLRARADDGALLADDEVTVEVVSGRLSGPGL